MHPSGRKTFLLALMGLAGSVKNLRFPNEAHDINQLWVLLMNVKIALVL